MPISLIKAQQLILSRINPLNHEQIPLLDATGRVLAKDLNAPWDMPSWNNSAMDGFAVRSEDCQGDATLTVSGYLAAGACADKIKVPRGHAIKIMTGAPVPDDCDAVVPIEEVFERSEEVVIPGRVKPGAHVRLKGEDLTCNELALSAGTPIGSAETSLLASLGQVSVNVVRRPRVAILSTGDELVELGSDLGPGQIINSNSYALAAAVREAGGEPLLLGIARDEGDSLRDAVVAGLAADALITSAGVSVGDRDMVRQVLTENNVEEVFWKVAIKPGKPIAFAMKDKTPVFSLPGNPVSAMVTFEMFVRPALLALQGSRSVFRMPVKAKLRQEVSKKPGRAFLLRVCLDSDEQGVWAISPGGQDTGIVSTMVKANGIAVLSAERERYSAGEEIDVLMLKTTTMSA